MALNNYLKYFPFPQVLGLQVCDTMPSPESFLFFAKFGVEFNQVFVFTWDPAILERLALENGSQQTVRTKQCGDRRSEVWHRL